MLLNFLKAKLHQATVTHAELYYDGSCAIDEELLDAANINPFEQIQIYNISNGERLTTYAIKGERGSGIISMNGAAARKASVGDQIIICAYTQLTAQELETFKPSLVYLGANNKIIKISSVIDKQTV